MASVANAEAETAVLTALALEFGAARPIDRDNTVLFYERFVVETLRAALGDADTHEDDLLALIGHYHAPRFETHVEFNEARRVNTITSLLPVTQLDCTVPTAPLTLPDPDASLAEYLAIHGEIEAAAVSPDGFFSSFLVSLVERGQDQAPDWNILVLPGALDGSVAQLALDLRNLGTLADAPSTLRVRFGFVYDEPGAVSFYSPEVILDREGEDVLVKTGKFLVAASPEVDLEQALLKARELCRTESAFPEPSEGDELWWNHEDHYILDRENPPRAHFVYRDGAPTAENLFVARAVNGTWVCSECFEPLEHKHICPCRFPSLYGEEEPF